MTLLRQEFLNRMILRNMAPGTQTKYLQAVVGLTKHFKCSPDKLLPQHVQNYLLFLIQERKLAWSTVRTLVYGLKFFYHDFLGRPCESYYIPSPKVPKKLPTVWAPQQIRAFLDAAKGLPLQTMIKIAYGSGLRANEVVHLRVPDIDSGHMTLWVRQGKRRKDRAALLTPSLLQDLRIYWLKYRPETWLFPSKMKEGKPIQAGSFGKRFAQLKETTGVADRPGRIHTLRHSFATHLVAAGADVYTVSRLLGHRKITTTMVYVHLAEGMVLKGARHLDLLTNQVFHD